jgi:splicing factor U2AF subunit
LYVCSSRARSDRRSSRSRSRERDRERGSRDRDGRSSSDRRRRSRSGDRDRDSRSRSRERRRANRKKKSGWDLAPEAAVAAGYAVPTLPEQQRPSAAAAAPAAPAVSGSVHPSRMAQLGNLPGAVPAAGAYNPLQHLQQQQPQQQPSIAAGLPPHLAALMNPSLSLGGLPAGFPGLTGGSIGAAQSNLPGTRQARRLYVGGIPIPIAEVELKQFFDVAMRSAFPDLPAGESVVSVYLNLDKKFAFVEFRTPEEATTGLGLDGIVMRGMTLRIKRPSDYNPSLHGSAPSASRISAAPMGGGAGGGAAAPFSGAVSSQVPDGPNKVFCGGLPYSLSEPEVMELLSSFGQLRAFHLVKDRETQQSKGCQLNTRTFHQSLRVCAALFAT